MNVLFCFKNNQKKILVNSGDFFNFLTQISDQPIYFIGTVIYLLQIKAICDMVKEKVLYTDDKAVIVSQWPSVLNLVNKQLAQYNVKTEIFSGAVPVLHRNKIISEFNRVKGGPKVNKNIILYVTITIKYIYHYNITQN